MIATLLILMAGGADGQEVRGTLVDESTGRTVAGATVLFLDSLSSPRAGARTDSGGAWSVRPVRSTGSFTIRAQKAGFATVETAPFRLGGEPVAPSRSTRSLFSSGVSSG